MKLFFRYLYVAVPIGIIVCIFSQMIVANQMIVYGNDLGRIANRIDELNEQNDLLSKKLIQQQSIQRVSYEAKKSGFVDAATYMAFTSDSFPVAIKR